MTHMQRELESLRTSEKSLRTTLRDMELDNDVLENSERFVLFSLESEPQLTSSAGRRTRRYRISRTDTARASSG